MRKPAICIRKNKGADQLCGNRTAYQCLCYCYIDSTFTLLPTCEISRLYPSSVVVQPGLCSTWSETPKTGFVLRWLIFQLLDDGLGDILKQRNAYALFCKFHDCKNGNFQMKICDTFLIFACGIDCGYSLHFITS